MNDDTPKRWPHNCDSCVHLGRYGPDDLYFCPIGEASVVVRFGPWADESRHLAVAHARRMHGRSWSAVALERAEKLGLLKGAA